MEQMINNEYIAFAGTRRIARGSMADIAVQARRILDEQPDASILTFDAGTSERCELDLRGTTNDILVRYPSKVSAGEPTADARPIAAGRPKLGVVAREVTLLPRHWDWLATQPGGASVTLRKLVDQARKESTDLDRIRQSREATYRFMSVMAGNLPGFEEASRALFASNREGFEAATESWPADIQSHLGELSGAGFSGDKGAS